MDDEMVQFSETGARRGRKASNLNTLTAEKLSFVPSKLTRQTLNEQVYAELRMAIISGQLLPGKILTVRALAQSFGVSIMPVREALSRLIAEQVLVLLPNRSVAVPVITADRFTQITRIRVIIESMAAVDGAKTLGREEIDKMAELNDMMERLDVDDHKTHLDLNRKFHFMIYNASRQDYIVGLIETFWMQVGPLLNLLMQAPLQAGQRRYAHHYGLLKALRRGDSAAAGDAIADDIRDAANVILATLPASAGQPAAG